jgi:hypothetical protein
MRSIASAHPLLARRCFPSGPPASACGPGPARLAGPSLASRSVLFTSVQTFSGTLLAGAFPQHTLPLALAVGSGRMRPLAFVGQHRAARFPPPNSARVSRPFLCAMWCFLPGAGLGRSTPTQSLGARQVAHSGLETRLCARATRGAALVNRLRYRGTARH